MISQEFLDWITEQHKKLRIAFGYKDKTQTEWIYAQTIKLNEEVGELCEEVLAENGDQRAEKLKNRDPNALAYEIADVITTALVLADELDIDINKAIKEKMKKIDERFKDIVIK